MPQLLLIPDPRPLDELLGKTFFRNLPKQPGVYLMRDIKDNVLYVGKAKDLHQRLQCYRTANPDRMPRRHLRMLRQVARIELQFCPDESAALEHESKLLRSFKPRFNRAGVWPGKTRFIIWRIVEDHLELAVTEVPEPDWKRFGPLGANSHHLHCVLSRMFWLSLNQSRTFAELPAGWSRGSFAQPVKIDCGNFAKDICDMLDALFWRSLEEFLAWLNSRFCKEMNSFSRAAIELDMEFLKEFFEKQQRIKNKPQLALL